MDTTSSPSMAAVAGMKRSFQQMNGHEARSRYSLSAPTSREPSPTPRVSRVATPNVLEGGLQVFRRSRDSSPRKATFDPDASLVMVGVKGVGKSSLGVLAATAYGRSLIESEREFQEATGQSTPAYRKLHGSAEYHRRRRQVLHHTLERHSRNCIIVLSFADLEYDGAELLRKFARDHAVIHILRDAKGVHSYLKVWTEDRVKQVMRISGPILRACSNYDFFNLSAAAIDGSTERNVTDEYAWSEARANGGPFLTLKRAEQDFLRLLRSAIGEHSHGPSHHSAYPLSQVPVERRRFTYAAVVDAAKLLANEVDLEEAQIGVDAIELVFDPASAPINTEALNGELDLNLLAKAFGVVRRATIFPIILSVARAPAKSDDPLHDCIDLNHICLRLGPEFCTVNLDASDQDLRAFMANQGRTQIIGVKAFSKRPPAGWDDAQCKSTYEHARDLGCAVVKITMPAKTITDNFAAQTFRARMEARPQNPRLIAYNVGPAGFPSLCFNTTLTPVRSASSSEDQNTALPVSIPTFTVKQLTTALFSTFVNEPMSYYVYGATVSWSLSPAMHNAAYKACGQVHRITTCSTGSLDILSRLVHNDDFGGAALTQPHKTTALALMDALSPHAKAIGAVNTIIPLRDLESDGTVPDKLGVMAQRNKRGLVKALFGDNTDWIGIRACIRRGLSPANTVRANSSGVVCGAGGMGRAAVYAMISMGVKNIFVCNRTPETAHALADHYNRQLEKGTIIEHNETIHARVRVIESFASPWPQDFRHPTMIVCTIPAEKPDGSSNVEFTVSPEWLKSPTGGVAVELSYKPLVTSFVKQMRELASRGWILMDGFDHLPEQAFGQYELFTGRRAPRKLMRDVVFDHFRQQGHLRNTRAAQVDTTVQRIA